jgi:cellulose synthase/poly-beta-1,6-N-acetylglucosamine synthase-like glycosyltransferase
MTNQANIDVIIITKHRDDTLLRCVIHLLLNSIVPKQIIIIHANIPSRCSTKKHVLKLCKQFQVHCVYKHVKDKGISYSRNVGLSLVQNEVFSFIDDDEIPSESWIQQAVSFFTKHPYVSVISGPKLPNNPHNYWNQIWECIYRPGSVSGGVDFVTSSNTFYRRHILTQHHITYDLQFATSSEDYVFSHKLKKAGASLYYHNKLVVYHDFRTTMGGFMRQWFDYGKTTYTFDTLYRHVSTFYDHLDNLWNRLQGVRAYNGIPFYFPGLLICDISFLTGYIRSWIT